MPARKISINLAARPLRNRRFYFTLIGGATALFLIVAALSLMLLLASRSREKAMSESLAGVRKEIAEARQDRDRWMAQIREWAGTYRTTVDALNAVLINKRFSWVEFLTRLEESLPSSCYIIYMAPLVAREGVIEARFKVSCPSLQELLSIIQKLNGQGFKDISVRQEAQLNGQLISEILFTHERAI
jgi:hypothetical protein